MNTYNFIFRTAIEDLLTNIMIHFEIKNMNTLENSGAIWDTLIVTSSLIHNGLLYGLKG